MLSYEKMLYDMISCYIISYYIILYHILSYYITLYHFILYYITLYYIILNHIILCMLHDITVRKMHGLSSLSPNRDTINK